MTKESLLEHRTTESIIGAFYHVYNRLGYGFLERVYALALEKELRKRGHRVVREPVVTIFYEGEPLTTVRLDMVVDGKVVVENKSSAVLPALHNGSSSTTSARASLKWGSSCISDLSRNSIDWSGRTC